MKLILLIICAVSISVCGYAQVSQRTTERLKRHYIEGRENAVFVTLATGVTSHNQAILSLKTEFSREITGNLFWGCALSSNMRLFSMVSYDYCEGANPYRNTINHDIFKADGMLYYRLPVIASRLFLRFGTGMGIGYLHSRKETEHDYQRDKVIPYFNFECAWILRCTKHFEMKLSPTIIFAPSTFAISPIKLGSPTDVAPWITDAGFSISFGRRF